LVLVERIFKTEAKAFETLEFIPNWKEESMKYGAQNKRPVLEFAILVMGDGTVPPIIF